MMFNKLMTATALVVVSGGLAFAQASGTGSTSTEGAGTSFQWDQTSQDSFFSDGALRSDSEVRAAYDALDTAQKDHLKAACDADATGSAASDTGATTGSGSTAGTAGTTTTDGATTSGATAGADSASSMPDAASMQQLCAQIQSY